MPELPDLTVYLEALEQRLVGQRLQRILLRSPFLLRTATPPIQSATERRVSGVRRLGKRLAIGLAGTDNAAEATLWLVFRLMIAGRLHWTSRDGSNDRDASGADGHGQSAARGRSHRSAARAPRGSGNTLASLDFEHGTLTLTEAGTRRRASLHLVEGEQGLRLQDPGGQEILDASLGEFGARLRSENHTLKRALTDPRLFSGIGNAYSDEILHAARLSPLELTARMDEAAIARLYEAAREQLQRWTERLRREAGGKFPEHVTAFRKDMAVHGRFRLPCPVCGTPVQRIRYADNETNYCPRCQTGGRLLADRALSRLLKQDWPRSIDTLDRES